MDWKELRAGLCRVMQHYCGEIKNEELLHTGLIWLDDIEQNIFPEVYAPNPHALMRVVETFNILTCDRAIIHAGLARKASSNILGFTRQDYPENDPPEWHKFITTKQVDGEIVVKERATDFAEPLSDHYEANNPDYNGFLTK
jgi:succinate dehydrogenase/fumarate reductase flavoprotein subunit